MSEEMSKGHPKGLYVLFFSEMWERFCYYGMRALLTVFLIDILFKGDTEAFTIYGTYTALVYMAPVLGGLIADKLLGYRNAVVFGGILMAIGEFILLGGMSGSEMWVFIGMAAIIVGNGYFKANISSIVGKLYKDGDPRRDSGFTIFYIGINIGALLATTVCAEVGRKVGYEYGFALAGIGMVLGTIIFIFGRKQFEHVAMPPNPELLNKAWIGPLSRFHVTIIGSLALIPVIYLLIEYNQVMDFLLPAVGIYVVYNLISAGIKEGPIWRDRMIVMIILFVFNIVFWSFFEQAGTSLTLFARRNVDRDIFGLFEMSDATTQFFNPAFIILFGSLFSLMWLRLDKIKKNPNIPSKFGFGIIQVGLGYLVINLSIGLLDPNYLVPVFVLAALYLLHTTGELFLSPIGLSMVTKLAPAKMTGTAMGGWFLSFAASNYVAGLLAAATGVGGHGGGGDGEQKTPTYADYQQVIVTSQQTAIKTADAIVAKTADFEEWVQKNAADNKQLAKLPAEIKTMAMAVGPTVEAIATELDPIFNDTASYTGQKAIRWTNTIPIYAGGIEGVAGSLEGVLTQLDNLMKEGGTYDKVGKDLGGAIIGVGGGFDGIGGLTGEKGRLTQFNDGYELTGLDNALKEWDPKYTTVAAHMTWDTYYSFFFLMAMIAIGTGLFLLLINKPLNKLMHGVT